MEYEVPDNLNPRTTLRLPCQNLISATVTEVLANEVMADIAALREKQGVFWHKKRSPSARASEPSAAR